MRKAVTLLIAVTVAGVSAAPAATYRRTNAGNGITIDVPPGGWRVVRRHITDVYDPAQRLAMTTFDLKQAGYWTCECGIPGFRRFPPNGAFLFVWEQLHDAKRMLPRTPSRPAHFHITGAKPQRGLCDGPSDEFVFKDGGRVFQVEVYIGPKTTARTRTQLEAALDSFHAAAAH